MGEVGAMSTYNWGEPTHLLSGMNHQVVILLPITVIKNNKKNNHSHNQNTTITTNATNHNSKINSGWWLGHPSEKYEFVNWDDNRNPILMGKIKIDGNQTTNQSFLIKF